MAEHVQAALDQMVTPLRDLMDRHIFTEMEIKAIVARRRESEYLLRRMAARKADFLRYIEQEMALERLRELRTLKSKRDHRKSQQPREDQRDDENRNKKPSKEKEHVGDIHIVQHIHLLFVRAIRKFRSDLSLHLQHAEFCKQQQSWTRLGRVYAEALQIFPKQPGLWIAASSHEFFGPARSIRNARVLLQRGLRFNDKSEELWIEYFSLEMHYAQTLKGRRQVLLPQLQRQKKALEEEEENDTNKEEYKIPIIVLKNALQAIPRSVQFRLQFMDVCKGFPNTEILLDFLQESIGRDFPSEPDAWIARALYEAERQHDKRNIQEAENDFGEHRRKKARMEEKDAVLSILGEAIEEVKTEEMLLHAYRFVEQYLTELQHLGMDAVITDNVELFIDAIWSKAHDCKSADLVMEHAQYLVNEGHAAQALERIKNFCTTQKSVPTKAWLRWASLAPRHEQKGILQCSLRKIPMDSPDYLAILLQLFGAQMQSDEVESEIHNSLQRILLLAPKTTEDILVNDTGLDFELPNVSAAVYAMLMHSFEKSGIQGARKVYSAVLFRSTLKVTAKNIEGVEKFVSECVTLENRIPNVDKKRLLRLHDKAVALFTGTSLEDAYREKRNENAIFD
jgi:U3 small nucleolar RNA-associated protein 6